MIEQFVKSMDRNLTLRNKDRPGPEAYLLLLNNEERRFASKFVSFISSVSPDDLKIAVILGGSLSRQYDKRLFGLPKREPHDVDLAITSGARKFYRLSSETIKKKKENFYHKVEKHFQENGLCFKRNAVESRFLIASSETVQYITDVNEKIRPFDIMFYEFFDYDATEELLELMQSKHSPGVVLKDERDPEYIAEHIAERKKMRELELSYGGYWG